jgi:membrane protein
MDAISRAARVFVRTAKRFTRDRCSAEARGLSYTFILSIIPFSIVVMYQIRHLGFYPRIRELLSYSLSRFLLPDEAVGVVSYVDTVLESARSIGALGIVFSIVMSFLLVLTLSNIVNRIWRSERQAPALRAFFKFLAIFVGAPLFLSAIVLIQNVLSSPVLLERSSVTVSVVFTTAISLILHWGLMAVLFGLMPHARVRFAFSLVAGVFSGTLWFFLRLGLNLYVRYIPQIGHLYGSLAFVPIFLIWIYISWLIVLFGVELNYTFHYERP